VAAVKINIDSDPDRISVHTEQPSSVTGFPWSWPGFKNDRRNDASVDYIIQVPEHARLADITSVNGSIEIDGVSGDIGTSTVNGDTQVEDAAGGLKLSTVNGRITAGLSRLGDGQSVSLDAVNGRIELAVPEAADAKFSVNTVNGGITSEFPSLEVKKEFPVSKSLSGSLGHGGGNVKITTVNGGVKILKRQTSKQASSNALSSASLAYNWQFRPSSVSPATNVPVLPAIDKSLPVSTNGAIASVAKATADAAAAMAAAQAWLKLIDAGNYSESWKQASAVVQGAAPEMVFAKAMETFRQPLGAVVSRQLKSAEPAAQLPGAADGQYVLMQFETSFANKQSAIETVTFSLEKDGQWKSAGYFIK
jgi:hypothetical protein